MKNIYTLKKRISMGSFSVPEGTIFNAELFEDKIKVSCSFGFGVFSFSEFNEYFEAVKEIYMSKEDALFYIDEMIEGIEDILKCAHTETEAVIQKRNQIKALKVANKTIKDYLEVEADEKYDY